MSKKPSAGGKIQWTKMFRKLSPYTIRKGFRYMKHYGPKEFWIRLHERFEPKKYHMVYGTGLTFRRRKHWKHRGNRNLIIHR